MTINWKKVATGVLAASVGAAAFGAVHYMFLAPQFGSGDVFGVPLSVILPFVVGTLGFTASAAMGSKVSDTVKAIIQYGSAAVIGAGIMQYAGWVSASATPAAARAPARYTPPARLSMPSAPMIPQIMSAGNATKMI